LTPVVGREKGDRKGFANPSRRKKNNPLLMVNQVLVKVPIAEGLACGNITRKSQEFFTTREL